MSSGLPSQIHEIEQLRWLGWSLRRSRVSLCTDQDLLEAIRRTARPGVSQELLEELERRLPGWSGNRHRTVAAILSQAHRRLSAPGPAAQKIDRLLRRLLWQLRGAGARNLALDCASSPRLQRRLAAWRFYSSQGLDQPARGVLAARAGSETNPHYARLLAHDSRLIEAVGLQHSLDLQDEMYWRGRVFETVLASGGTPANADAYPAEAIFGIRRAVRRDLIPAALRLLERNRSSPSVVNASIQCFGELGATTELSIATAAGIELLEQLPRMERELLRSDALLEDLEASLVPRT
jgi:hypothetical protein